jgi:hypothetical protein
MGEALIQLVVVGLVNILKLVYVVNVEYVGQRLLGKRLNILGCTVVGCRGN